MNRKIYLNIFIVTIFAISPVFYFYLRHRLYQSEVSYNFTRNIPYKVYGIQKLNLGIQNFYLAGKDDSIIYLANKGSTNYILLLNSDFSDTTSVFINIPNKDYEPKGTYKTIIKNGIFYLTNGFARSIISGSINEWKGKSIDLTIPYFWEAVPVSKKSIIFRYINANTKSNSLRKETSANRTIENKSILEKQLDGIFCTSGQLLYNEFINRMVYMYHFRNQILITDTNLNLKYSFRTIDPIDSVRIAIGEIKSENTKVLTEHNKVVNNRCAHWKHYLFIQSKIMGKSEDKMQFEKSDVLDIYDIRDGKYLYSIYLVMQGEDHISDFWVAENSIYTIAGKYIYRYAVTIPR